MRWLVMAAHSLVVVSSYCGFSGMPNGAVDTQLWCCTREEVGCELALPSSAAAEQPPAPRAQVAKPHARPCRCSRLVHLAVSSLLLLLQDGGELLLLGGSGHVFSPPCDGGRRRRDAGPKKQGLQCSAHHERFCLASVDDWLA